MTDIDGSALSMSADFGTIGFGTLEPGNSTLEEQICFTGLSNNTNGTVTLTGVSNVSFLYPYTRTSGLLKTHAGASTFIISNTSGFYDELTGKTDDETITGTWTFTNPNYPRMDTATPFPIANEQLATKAYADSLTFTGAPDATQTQKGIVQIATRAQYDAGTLVGSTSAFLVVTPDILHSYLVDTGSPNVIKIAPSPSISSYVAGQMFSVKLLNTNTSPTVSVNINGLGNKTLLKGNGIPVAGDFVSNDLIVIEYDGTNFQTTSVAHGTINVAATPSVGDVIYYGGSAWISKPIGTAGQILVTNASANAPTYVTYGSRIFIGSSAVASGTGAKSITGVGFRPSFIEFFWVNSGTDGANAHWEHTGNGKAKSSSSRFAQYRINSAVGSSGGEVSVGAATIDSANVIFYQSVTYSVNTPTVNNLFVADFTSFDADGFTLNVTTSTSQPTFTYVAYQ